MTRRIGVLALALLALATRPVAAQSAAQETAPRGVQVRLDGLSQTPVLNVVSERAAVARGETVAFIGYSNYAAWIGRYELRIFAEGESPQGAPLAVVTPSDSTPTFQWTAAAPAEVSALTYVLRVYAADARFDETAPKPLGLLDRAETAGDSTPSRVEWPRGYDENHRAVANISVAGGSVVVYGDSLDPSATVTVLGRPVPVDRKGSFVASQILPAGAQVVTVLVADSVHGATELRRELFVPRTDWFSLALLDLTVGNNSVDGPATLVTSDDDRRYEGGTYAHGRVAFYLKGRLSGSTRLTASADTREEPLGDLTSNFLRRDPRALLRRLDPNTYYPTYGDDATLVEDAPTQGNFYVKAERHDSYLQWGSFQTQPAGTDLVNFSRGLYGGELQLRSGGTTGPGERKTEIGGFAADPGTVSSREEFTGTGGSLYYLRHQDILIGSEHVRVEVRDRDSDIILASTTLEYGQDYELNALQGRLTLRTPLSSVAERPTLVRVGALDGNRVVLVVTYEYSPEISRVDNLTTGGRASQWLGDHVRFGATGYRQRGTGMEQELLGGDVTLRYRPGTYLTVEHARSEGPGTLALASPNGGFDFATLPQAADDQSADATRAEVAIDLTELSAGLRGGTITSYWLDRGAGFSAPGQLTGESVRQSGVAATIPVSRRLSFGGKADLRDGNTSGEARAVEVDAGLGVTDAVTLQVGVRNDYRETGLAGGASALLSETGERTDAIGKLEYAPLAAADSAGGERGPGRYAVYGLVQGTLDRDAGRAKNDRYGLGGRFRTGERLTLKGEATDGDGGVGGLLGAELRVTERSDVYLNYVVDADRSDLNYRGRTGNFTTGGRLRYSDATSVFVERRHQSLEGGASGLSHAFGLDLATGERWTWSLKLEAGTLADSATGDLERRSASLASGYHSDKLRWGGALEYRTEESDLIGRRVSWLLKNTAGYQAAADWRLLGSLNLATSDAGQALPADAEYTEVVAGFAYRPVRSNRFNGLFRYTYLYDLASPGQVAGGLRFNPFAQRSHILSADGTYAVSSRLSLGSKLGHRTGQIRDNSVAGSQWTGSAAWLAIGRADWHVVHKWDLLGEVRSLTVEEARSTRAGVLLGVYRHITGDVKLGVGYNFTDYSDDLSDLSYRSRGVFVNLVGSR